LQFEYGRTRAKLPFDEANERGSIHANASHANVVGEEKKQRWMIIVMDFTSLARCLTKELSIKKWISAHV
jgi:hypothetical protein